jgi:hypothetical protein
MSKSSYATNAELLEQIADDLVQMHYETGIDLAYWSTGLEIVRRFYDIDIEVIVKEKKHV